MSFIADNYFQVLGDFTEEELTFFDFYGWFPTPLELEIHLQESFPELPSIGTTPMEPVEYSRGKKKNPKGRPTVADVLKGVESIKIPGHSSSQKGLATIRRQRKSQRLLQQSKSTAESKLHQKSHEDLTGKPNSEADTDLPAANSEVEMEVDQKQADLPLEPPTEQEISMAEETINVSPFSKDEAEEGIDCGTEPVRALKHPGIPLSTTEGHPSLISADVSLLADQSEQSENWEEIPSWAESLYHASELLYYYLLGATNRALQHDPQKQRSLYHFCASLIPSVLSMYDPTDEVTARILLRNVKTHLVNLDEGTPAEWRHLTSEVLDFIAAFLTRFQERVFYQQEVEATVDSYNRLYNSLSPLCNESEQELLMSNFEKIFTKAPLETHLSESLRNLLCYLLQQLYSVVSSSIITQMTDKMPPLLQTFALVNQLLDCRKKPVPTTIDWTTLPYHLEYRRQYHTWKLQEEGDSEAPSCILSRATECKVATLHSLEVYDQLRQTVKQTRAEALERERLRLQEEERARAQAEQAERERIEQAQRERDQEMNRVIPGPAESQSPAPAPGHTTERMESDDDIIDVVNTPEPSPQPAGEDSRPFAPSSQMDFDAGRFHEEGTGSNYSQAGAPIECYLLIVQGDRSQVVRLPNPRK
ncbi:Oidioi.mRNA.OKI2018_I69.chr1.g520.t1.cds [Oikopleura dioica]|uniref:Oidioi.mRNA.OKI2018_I69.chr1.g520.t1.cds n=1 Tax=Oikopleura dioica TaxID=34765 RepID=A0ABN7SK36_OIKDI|nr:Oidioi.mRNA.OKI2018_I69.chr1.g520.t1.cds [Oikopleura dioica]